MKKNNNNLEFVGFNEQNEPEYMGTVNEWDKEDEISQDYPIGCQIEQYDIEREKDLTF